MILKQDFYCRHPVEVAKALIGKKLVRIIRGKRVAGLITETEAYGGPEDLASHASKKKSKRAEVMFGPPGCAYVYLVYGMYHCFNIVTLPEGKAGAVLVRAVEPVEGIEIIGKNRRMAYKTHCLCNGPGKLCRAFSIDMKLNRTGICGGCLFVEDNEAVPCPIEVSPRIGVDYAGAWAEKPWRFKLK